MNIYEQYFSDNSIVIADVMNYIAPALPDYLYDSDGILAQQELTIPDDTTYDKVYFEFTRSKHIINMFSANLGRITALDAASAYTTITGAESTDLSADTDSTTVALHGRGMLFETDEDTTTVTLRYNYITKNATTMHEKFYDNFMACYFYLYTRSSNEYYHYMRALSLDKKNNKVENKNIPKARRRNYGQIKPWAL